MVTLLVAVVLPFAMEDQPGTFLQNVMLLQAWTSDGAHSFNWVSWSISAEAFFYLLFPLVIRVLRGRAARTLLATAAIAWLVPVILTAALNRAVPDYAFFLTYDFPPFRFGEFLVGVCLALWMKQGVAISAFAARVVVGGSALCVAVILGADVLHPLGRSYDSALFVPVVLVAIFGSATRDVAGKRGLLHRRSLITLGQWSFALYLVHMLVIRVLAAVIGAERAAYLPWWAAILAVMLSVLLSGLAFQFIEKPLERRLRIGRRMPARLSA
jgi:peptidoglycan/LPS O-acetylase OafA/YrhL